MLVKNDDSTILIVYNCESGSCTYLSDTEALGLCPGEKPFWRQFWENGTVSRETAEEIRKEVLAAAAAPQAKFREIYLHSGDLGWRTYQIGYIATEAGKTVTVTLTDLSREAASMPERSGGSDVDELTGLYRRKGFCARVDKLLQEDPQGAAEGGYGLIYFDIHRFKVINDLFGRDRGDQLLRDIAGVIRRCLAEGGCACRVVSDHFAVLQPAANGAVDQLLDTLRETLRRYDLPFEVAYHAGIYVTTEETLSCNTMIDRAALAQTSIKEKYNVRTAQYTEDMRRALLGEQEIVGMMSTALAEKQFRVYYQPQYNHSTGMLVGAEALVRWEHPEKGLITPVHFLPIFEKNGFITNLDLYVFEEVCAFLRKCMDAGWVMVPVSTNFSRYDIFMPDFVNWLERIREKYDVPTKYLRVELTESAMMNGTAYVNEVIAKLHQKGYIVEMDDFGSGYSSLNTLKDIDLDIIKLDMQFLSGDSGSKKGGTILSSIVRMAKWLGLPVIAEGVETVEQADFLRSIGCDYIQGYLYARPLPESAYISLISGSRIGAAVPQMQLIETMNAYDFWNPNSQETLIFSNYVGGAAIFDYHDGEVEILRVNKKYLQELSMNLSEKELIEADPLASMDAHNRKIYLDMIQQAIDTMDEQECETWRTITSSCCGEERFCIRSTVRVVGVSGNRYLLYGMIRNITGERLYYGSLQDNERRFKMASEQVNIYFWEYTIATKEMRPCFRCQRDLGLPPLLTNYPEPVIENHIFPPEMADMYRDWHRQVAQGVPSLEAVIPLTPDRVPFRVRYTTEFDENGHPVKAYGSAALIVN